MLKCCLDKIYWKQLGDYFEFLDNISIIQFSKVVFGIEIPEHCMEGVHHQQLVKIHFEPTVSFERARDILNMSGFKWEGLSKEKNKNYCTADAGSVFTRPGHTGYWVLVAPCLDCYFKLVKQNPNGATEIVLKSFL